MSYDPAYRRRTPLAAELTSRIGRDGPMTVADYMAACLGDPEYGYYRVRTAIGRTGDFITAPEISQVFGELIGLWSAVVWQQWASPAPVRLIEIGPGRGTMMADALRAGRRVPGFGASANVSLVDPSLVLRQIQSETLKLSVESGALGWHDTLGDVLPGPSIVLANEVLDVLPVAQYVRRVDGWVERGVGIDSDGALRFCDMATSAASFLDDGETGVKPGDVIERTDTSSIVRDLSRRAAGAPLAALFIDYGHEAAAVGDTLQAVRGHAYEHPLTSPGEADLTAQVDFQSFAGAIRGAGLLTQGPVTQADFLGGLGIVERASRLMSSNPERASGIEMAVARLMAPQGMGTRFKVLGVRGPSLPPLPGLP
jgi:SAM-dependent MidA family methyltransferase